MKTELHLLKDGLIGFDEFARRTEGEWLRLARRIYFRWRTPAGVEVRDIAQELVMSAWRNSAEWIRQHGGDAVTKSTGGHPMALEAYVVWMACREAERWVHQQRNSMRRSARAPGRFERSWSEYGEDSDWVEPLLAQDAMSESIVIGLEAISDVIEALETEAERIAVYAWLATGSADQAVAYLESDAKRRSALNLWTDGAARRLVNRSLATSAAILQDVV